MNILICTKLSLPDQDKCIPDWRILLSKGHNWWCSYKGEIPLTAGLTPNVIIGMGVGAMEETYAATERYPDAKFFAYNWDTYSWVWTNPRPNEYDYHRYGRLLSQAKEIWTPSKCTSLATERWWNLPSKVIHSSIPLWDWHDTLGSNYILCTLRELPDSHWHWFERACEELGLPYLMTNHNESLEQYKKSIANCRFMVSHIKEASTGGLSLLEGYYHGKPCLISDSPDNGASDYFGDRAIYFDHRSYSNFKIKLQNMWTDTPIPKKKQAQDFVKGFSDDKMIDAMLERIAQCP